LHQDLERDSDAYALSSAEAELYTMVEGLMWAKGLTMLVRELGMGEIADVVKIGTDSSAAKSFVSRRGLGKMRHIQIRDLWPQKEVAEGRVEVSKVRGEENPADLLTKVLTDKEIGETLDKINVGCGRSGR
jgi:hypothetical protein